jgi:hypothetical protein
MGFQPNNRFVLHTGNISGLLPHRKGDILSEAEYREYLLE